MTAPLTVRPIVFTTEPAGWLHLLDGLGARTVVDGRGWSVLALRAGRVAVHAVGGDDPLAGTTRLAFEVPDLDGFQHRHAAALEAAGATVESATAGHGRLLRVRAADGTELQVDPREPELGTPPATAPVVMPLWYSPDVATAQATLEALGLQPRISSDSGGWVDLAAPEGGGQHAAHYARRPGTQLSFEHDDVVALVAQLDLAGIAADVIDESYGRTAHISNPERPDEVEARVWVNEVQRDLYGYRRLSS